MGYNSKRGCPDCSYNLSYLFKHDGKCKNCNGTGEAGDIAESIKDLITAGLVEADYTCRVCSGTGQCQTCGGTGYQYYNEDEDCIESNEEFIEFNSDEIDSDDSSYDQISAVVEQRMENKVTWIENLFWYLPIFLYHKIKQLFRKPISNDRLYMELVFILTNMREFGENKTIMGFSSYVMDLPEWVDTKCELENWKLNSSQHIYVNTVCKSCRLNLDKIRDIVDQLIQDRKSSNPGLGYLAILNELDNIFRPIDGGDGSVVILRAAEAA